jgi:glycosyltransferase involved in cell wall biosynthesis
MPDVLLSFGEWFNPYVILATRFMGIPLYISDRMGPELSIGPLLETSKKLVYRFASGIIAQTNIAASIIQKKTGAKNIKVIPNPVHVINTDISLKKKQIVTVGRLSREKGHIILIRAFAAMEQNDWYLHIVGDGKERPSLENEVRKFGIQERVIFHGQIKNFHQILGESSIFVLPSFYEGFPNALLEAMSVPLACISSDCIAGPGDIIQNGKNGILVATGDVNKLIEALNLLTTDSILREQLASEAIKVREIYNFETIANHYLNFLFL